MALRVHPFLLLLLLLFSSLAAAGGVDKLRIGIKRRAKACEREARNGDAVAVHYTVCVYVVGVFRSSLACAFFRFLLPPDGL